MPTATLALDEAVDLARTGDIWLFRGHTPADRAIQLATNSPEAANVDVEKAPATPIPLHSGAARYYREREVLK